MFTPHDILDPSFFFLSLLQPLFTVCSQGHQPISSLPLFLLHSLMCWTEHWRLWLLRPMGLQRNSPKKGKTASGQSWWSSWTWRKLNSPSFPNTWNDLRWETAELSPSQLLNMPLCHAMAMDRQPFHASVSHTEALKTDIKNYIFIASHRKWS